MAEYYNPFVYLGDPWDEYKASVQLAKEEAAARAPMLPGYMPVSGGSMFMGFPEEYVGQIGEPAVPPSGAMPAGGGPTDWNVHLGLTPSLEPPAVPLPQWQGGPISAASSPEEIANAVQYKDAIARANRESAIKAIQWQGAQDYNRIYQEEFARTKNPSEAALAAAMKTADKIYYGDPVGATKFIDTVSKQQKSSQSVIRSVPGIGLVSVNPMTLEHEVVVPSQEAPLGEMSLINDETGKPKWRAVRTGANSIHIDPIEPKPVSEWVTRTFETPDGKVVFRGSPKDADAFEKEYKSEQEKEAAKTATPASENGWNKIKRLFWSTPNTNAPSREIVDVPNSATPITNATPAFTNTQAAAVPPTSAASPIRAPVPVPPVNPYGAPTYPDYGPQSGIPYQFPDFGPAPVPIPPVRAAVTNAQGMMVPEGATNTVGLTPDQLRKLNATTNVLDNSKVPIVRTKAEYDALPVGAIYRGTNGKLFKKL